MDALESPRGEPPLDRPLVPTSSDSELSVGQQTSLPRRQVDDHPLPGLASELLCHMWPLSSEAPSVRPLRAMKLAELAGVRGVARFERPMPDTISFARGAPSADILPHEQVRDAAQRALTDDWETALSYGVGIGHPGLCKWVAERHGGVDPSQVMITNGSLEAGAMLFAHLVKPGTRVAVEQPTYDRTLLLLQQLGAELVPIPLESDGLDVAALRSGARRGADRVRPRDPQRPQPGRLHALGGEAAAAGAAGGRARLLDLRGRPLPRAPLRGRAAGDDALARRRRQGLPRLLVLEDGQPRRPGRLPDRPGRGDREARQARQRAVHLAQHAGRVDRARALHLGRPRREHPASSKAS